MSYCRIGADSDVYLIKSGEAWLCMSCSLTKHQVTETLPSRRAALLHLAWHERAGHKVPSHPFTRLILEMQQNGELDVSRNQDSQRTNSS